MNTDDAQMQDVRWLQTITSLPILVKGVMTAEDSKFFQHASVPKMLHLFLLWRPVSHLKKLVQNAARIAIEYGAAGIIVSNHGARQLDYVPATISCLEEVCVPTSRKPHL